MKTDAQIQKDVMDEFEWEPALDSAEIGVSVKNGVVTLSGTVNSYAKKVAAEKAASRVAGVKAVAEDIEVKVFSSWQKNDTEIAQAVTNALKWNSSVKEETISVKVDDGWVTLDGKVEWEFQKNSARRSVESLLGVKGVIDLIRVTPSINMRDVKQKIVSSFQRHANIDASRINVETDGSKVILTGKVRSLSEKDDAENAAWSAPGVTRVENKLEVDYFESMAAY